MLPIRYPVYETLQKANGQVKRHYYDHPLILAWLQKSQTSPLTRRPLTENDLTIDVNLRDRIERRIQELEDNNN